MSVKHHAPAETAESYGQDQGHSAVSFDFIGKCLTQGLWTANGNTVPCIDKTLQLRLKFSDRYTGRQTETDRQINRQTLCKMTMVS